MKVDVLTSGYVSMDHIIKIATPAKVGFTSLVTNKSNSKIFYGGCKYCLCTLPAWNEGNASFKSRRRL